MKKRQVPMFGIQKEIGVGDLIKKVKEIIMPQQPTDVEMNRRITTLYRYFLVLEELYETRRLIRSCLVEWDLDREGQAVLRRLFVIVDQRTRNIEKKFDGGIAEFSRSREVENIDE